MVAIRSLGTTFLALAVLAGTVFADGPAKVGLGSYAVDLPAGAKQPPSEVYKTDDIRGPLPTNQWWSSLLWAKYSEPQHSHPLAVRATAAGLQIHYPGPSITVAPVGIIGGMPAGGLDFILGHSAVDQFPDARLAAWSDWFVTASFSSAAGLPAVAQAKAGGMRVTYGHGSPFVYAMYEKGEPRLTFTAAPTVWSGGAGTPVLGITVGRRHYGLFGPAGATWSGLGEKVLVCRTGGKPYFSVAVLPDNSPETLALFRRHAYAHVTDTKVEWSFDEKTSRVTTRFAFTTRPCEGTESETLFALYPHQWDKAAGATLTGHSYASVRGEMKLARGRSFETVAVFPGVLPALPDCGKYDKARLRQFVEEEARAPRSGVKDTYWEGKRLGRLATLSAIAEQVGAADAAAAFLGDIRDRLQTWFTASEAGGGAKKGGLFFYDRFWGTLIGYPASYGSDTQLNDHHFHYGYFLQAAAEVARHDATWAAEQQWGGMVRLVIRDIASPDRADAQFPRLRCFDPYAGHSWASGHAKFLDGNNQESSSEAMNAWTGIILWGQATGDRRTRDLGIYLYTTEMEAINAYWFDVLGRFRPPSFRRSTLTMIWGGKGTYETWFSGKPEIKHGINWLPFHGGSLYLGLYPEYVRRNYDDLAAERGNTDWQDWADLVWMYRALDDPADAMRMFEARPASFKPEAGNSIANAYHWIGNLAALGHVDCTVTADYPLYAVFRSSAGRTHVVYNMEAQGRTVRFSDGATVQAPARGFAVKAAPAAGR